jgi:hypothetical protein
MKYLLTGLSLLIATSAQAKDSAQYKTTYSCGNIACALECVSTPGQPGNFSKTHFIGQVTFKVLENGVTVVELKEVQNDGRIETWLLPAGGTCKIL